MPQDRAQAPFPPQGPSPQSGSGPDAGAAPPLAGGTYFLGRYRVVTCAASDTSSVGRSS